MGQPTVREQTRRGRRDGCWSRRPRSLCTDAHNPKAETVAAARRRFGRPVGRSTKDCGTVPASAAHDPQHAGCWPRRISTMWLAIIRRRKPVRTPFGSVAMHIEQAKPIRRITSHVVGKHGAVRRTQRILPSELVPGRQVANVGDLGQVFRVIAVPIPGDRPLRDRRIPTPPRSAGDRFVPPSGSTIRKTRPRRASSR